MTDTIKVALASGSEDLIPTLIERMKALYPELPLYVVSEFPPPEGMWIPYHVNWSLRENSALCRARLRGKRIRLAGVILQPRMPYWRMRLMGLLLSPAGFIAFNENLDHFMLRPRCAGTILGHFWWRAKNLVRWELRPGGATYSWLWRLRHPSAFGRPLLYLAAWLAGASIAWLKRILPAKSECVAPQPGQPGISVVVPSRDGRELLARLLPGLRRELEGFPSETIIIDNGSTDGTAEWLRVQHPDVLFEYSAAPLSFARAANRGLARARYSHICLLNNDMTLEAGFFAPLREAFSEVPDLFSATAQILFPEGARRQETGKAVRPSRRAPKSADFPVRCDLPIPGENLSYVLYGSGGCSLYSAGKLGRLGGFDESYTPFYVEDLDAGYRAWQRGWPTVFVAGARVVHRHRATTARYYTPETLARITELNYLRFLARAIRSPGLFRELWREAIGRLDLLAARTDPSPVAQAALRKAWQAVGWISRPPRQVQDERHVLALGSGDVAVFPGRRRTGKPVVLVASPYVPFPLAHGGAVRIYNLMRRAAAGYDQVLVAFAGELATPPPELLEFCAEIVLVRLVGSHLKPSTARPDEVEEFDAAAFRAALHQTVRKWRPAVAQLEYTQMAQYAADCAPAQTILVEHDITFDLYRQMLAPGDDWEIRRKYQRWHRFEVAAWKTVDCVAAMSEKDRQAVTGGRAVCLPNGVDLARFRPVDGEPDAARLLFIGSFAHLPNVLAMEWFLKEVWGDLAPRGVTLHVIAGKRHQYYLDHYRDRVSVDLAQPGIEVEDFVADVRPAYCRATVVIAPLVASAGTNIKILEAMAMGKAIVSTPAGINGLDLADGKDAIVVETGARMAEAIAGLLDNPERRKALEEEARRTVERQYSWDGIAGRQAELYESLRPTAA